MRAHDVVDGLSRGFVVGRVGGNDAVPVEAGGGEDFRGVGHIVERDGLGVGLAQVFQDALGPGAQILAGLGGLADGVDGQRSVALEEVVQIAEDFPHEAKRLENLGNADATVLVGVEEIQRARGKLQPARGTGQRQP